MSNVEIAVTRLPHNADLPLPAYETAQSAGMDLAAAIDGPVTLDRFQALPRPETPLKSQHITENHRKKCKKYK